MKKYILPVLLLCLSTTFIWSQKVDRSKAPKAGPAPKIQIGSYQLFTLENGLKVIVVENHKLPTVSYSLQLEIDPIKEGEKAGYVSAAGELMTAGTTTRSKDEISNAVDFIGAQLSSGADGIFASSLKKHSETILELMSDVLLHPSYPEAEIEKSRKKILSGLVSEKTDPNSISSKIGNMVKYGKNHPYGEMMTEETVNAYKREDLVNYYNTYFKPNVSYLIIVGDISAEDAKAQAQKYFGSWGQGVVPKMKFRTPKAPAGNEIVFVPMPGAVQSVIDITYALDLVPATNEALYASVLNNILGGSGFQTRLMQNLREDKAYTYGAYSEISPDDYTGNFSAGASVRNAVTDSSITQLLLEMRRLTTEKVDENTLQIVKNIMTGQFARSLERPQTVARFAKNIEKYGLPKNFYETYLERLNAVTADNILQIAQRLLLPQNAYITVVGNKDILPTLLPFDKDGKTMIYNPDGSVFVDMKPVPAGVTSSTVLQAYIKACGGEEKLGKIKTMTQKGMLDAGMAKLDMNIDMVAGQSIKMVLSMNGSPFMTQLFHDNKLSISQMGQKMEGDENDVLQAKIQCDPLAELHLEQYGMKLNLKGIENLNGKDAYAMEITAPNGDISTDYYDVATGLKLKTISVKKDGDKTTTSETIIVEYMEMEGMKFPKKIKQSGGGQDAVIITDSITINPKFKKNHFE
jgi:predicted Zn-dependent peptidase